jgi:hypothetical protein
VLEQKKSQNELGVFGRPPDVGKVLDIFELKLIPRDELTDAKPTVPFIEAAPKGEKLGEENLSFTVLGLVHAEDLRVKVHGFRGGIRKNRAFGALNRSAVCHIIILMSIAYMELGGFSADPNYTVIYKAFDLATPGTPASAPRQSSSVSYSTKVVIKGANRAVNGCSDRSGSTSGPANKPGGGGFKTK